MILVIFGAGASYDSVPSRPLSQYPRDHLSPPAAGSNVVATIGARLPLAKELFLSSGVFADAQFKFPECHPIIPYLQGSSMEGSLEHVLEMLQFQAESDPVRRRQLAAIRYYLHFAIWECERKWSEVIQAAGGSTNYITLLDQLRRVRGSEPVGLVTFNYDRMIETALRSVDVTIDAIPHYIANDAFKLFKLHGSVHWAREVETPIVNIEALNEWEVARELIAKAGDLTITSRYRIVEKHPIGKVGDVTLFPAIALPVETKQEYECPKEHLDCLRSLLPRVTKILIVGWRGAEQHFLGLLKELLSGEVPVCVVAGKKQSDKETEPAEEVLNRMQDAGIRIAGSPVEGGFTEFVRRPEALEGGTPPFVKNCTQRSDP